MGWDYKSPAARVNAEISNLPTRTNAQRGEGKRRPRALRKPCATLLFRPPEASTDSPRRVPATCGYATATPNTHHSYKSAHNSLGPRWRCCRRI